MTKCSLPARWLVVPAVAAAVAFGAPGIEEPAAAPAAAPSGIQTFHYDIARTGCDPAASLRCSRASNSALRAVNAPTRRAEQTQSSKQRDNGVPDLRCSHEVG